MADLTVQFGKVERLYILLSTVVSDVIKPLTDLFGADRRPSAKSTMSMDDIVKQTIYTITLQVKATTHSCKTSAPCIVKSTGSGLQGAWAISWSSLR